MARRGFQSGVSLLISPEGIAHDYGIEEDYHRGYPYLQSSEIYVLIREQAEYIFIVLGSECYIFTLFLLFRIKNRRLKTIL